MNALNYAFLIVFLGVLLAILGSSPILRAGVWDTIRHPFTHSVVEMHGNKIEVRHIKKAAMQGPDPDLHIDRTSTQSKSGV